MIGTAGQVLLEANQAQRHPAIRAVDPRTHDMDQGLYTAAVLACSAFGTRGSTMKCIVAATDGSKGAERAVEFAAALAKTGDADLWIINVSGAEPKIAAKELEAYARSEHISPDEILASVGEEVLAKAKDLALGGGAQRVRVDVQSGDPAEAIMQCARERQADVIVVGRRGRGRLAGLLLGSVSQKVVALAPCAVLVVP